MSFFLFKNLLFYKLDYKIFIHIFYYKINYKKYKFSIY